VNIIKCPDLTGRLENLKQTYADNPEAFHIYADELIWSIMKSLGYEEAINFLEKQELWYS